MLLVVWAFSGWMVVDLKTDREKLREANEEGASVIFNTKDIRNELVRMIKALCIAIIFYPMLALLFGWYNPLEDANARTTITRVLVVTVVGLLLFSSAGDRYSRNRASMDIQGKRFNYPMNFTPPAADVLRAALLAVVSTGLLMLNALGITNLSDAAVLAIQGFFTAVVVLALLFYNPQRDS